MHSLRVFLAALGIFALIGTAQADTAEPAGAGEARSIIDSQLDAFQAKDLETAYSFAAPTIRQKFVDPQIFGEMVRNGYPMVWNPASREFLDASPFGPQGILQRLRIVDQAGRVYIAEYQLLRIDGEWRISGVRIERDGSLGA